MFSLTVLCLRGFLIFILRLSNPPPEPGVEHGPLGAKHFHRELVVMPWGTANMMEQNSSAQSCSS